MAKHIDYIEWIDDIDTLDTDLGHLVLREFLLRTPTLEASARSDGWINRFRIHDSDDAEMLFEELTTNVRLLRNVNPRYASSAKEVEKLLREENLLEGRFWESSSFAVYTVPNDAKKQVESAIDSAVSQNSLLQDKKRQLVKAKYLQVDALFRHIRNAIAHGAFQIKKVDDRHKVCIFQDSSVSGDLSARIVLGEEILREWVASFSRYEQNGV